MYPPTHNYGFVCAGLCIAAATAVIGAVGTGASSMIGKKGDEAQAEAMESTAYLQALSDKAQATIKSAYAPVWAMGAMLGIAAISLGVMGLRRKN